MDNDAQSDAQAFEAESHGTVNDAAHFEALPSKATQRIESVTHPVFILAYCANLVLVTANATLFIFADWVKWLSLQGGVESYSEELPGQIVRVGLLASIATRSVLGMSIDFLGVRIVWAFMAVLTAIGAALFLGLEQFSTLVYVGRMCVVVGIAGMFTCSAFHIQDSVAEHRRTEFLALLGTSGFVGIIIGAQFIAFLKQATGKDSELYFGVIFWFIICSMVVYVVCTQACLMIARNGAAPGQGRPPLFKLMVKHWPGPVAFVAMTMGLLFTAPSIYLTRFISAEEFGTIAPFWTVYAISAFAFRIGTSTLSRRVGRYRLITVGLLAQGLGMLALVPVTEWWHLMFAGAICGFGHSLLFPSIVSLGSGSFPAKYRGSGTNLILGCFDLGAAISAPLLGAIIDRQAFGGEGFRPMFAAAGAIPIALAIVWIFLHKGRVDGETSASRRLEVQ